MLVFDTSADTAYGLDVSHADCCWSGLSTNNAEKWSGLALVGNVTESVKALAVTTQASMYCNSSFRFLAEQFWLKLSVY